MFVEEGHRYPGNYRKQRYQQNGFKPSIAIIRRKPKYRSMKSTLASFPKWPATRKDVTGQGNASDFALIGCGKLAHETP
jgi:hypothetical protein